MHGSSNMHADTEAAVTSMVSLGSHPVVVWLPKSGAFDVYLCKDDRVRRPNTLRVVAHMGSAVEATGFDRGTPTWAAYSSGASYKQFKLRATRHDRAATRIVMPCGRYVYAV